MHSFSIQFILKNKSRTNVSQPKSLPSTTIKAYLGHFLGGGQQLHPAKIQSLPAEISSCQGGHVFCQAAVPSFSVKLSCQSYKLSSAKLQASQFCSAKLPFLSCQGPISVLPKTHFCPAKLLKFSRGGQGPPGPSPKYAYDYQHINNLHLHLQ